MLLVNARRVWYNGDMIVTLIHVFVLWMLLSIAGCVLEYVFETLTDRVAAWHKKLIGLLEWIAPYQQPVEPKKGG